MVDEKDKKALRRLPGFGYKPIQSRNEGSTQGERYIHQIASHNVMKV